MAQPRSQRDQTRNVTSSNSREPFFNDRESRTPSAPLPYIAPQQPNPMSMLYQRSMGQVPMMGGGMPMMNMNPMAMAMGMGMNGYNQMGGMNGMNMMGGMNGMNNMNGMGGMGGMGAMRLGMGPVGMGMGTVGMGNGGAGVGGPVGVGVGGMGMGMRPGMGVMNPNFGRMAMNAGPGPARISNRGQHSFHPYAR